MPWLKRDDCFADVANRYWLECVCPSVYSVLYLIPKVSKLFNNNFFFYMTGQNCPKTLAQVQI